MFNTRNTLGTAAFAKGRSVFFGLALAVAALALLATSSSAQEVPVQEEQVQEFDILGSVVDAERGTPIEGAWVGLAGTEWGSITDNEGRFRIPDMTAGSVSLKVESLGYETLDWVGQVADDDEFLTIGLDAQPVLLEGLRVVTDRFESRRKGVATSSFAYDVGDLASATQQTALDFVGFRSAASVINCAGRRGDTCLFLRGRAVEPVVYVDENPLLGGLEYLSGFAPWEFYKIEIYAGGRHIRAYTPSFMERAAKERLSPIALLF